MCSCLDNYNKLWKCCNCRTSYLLRCSLRSPLTSTWSFLRVSADVSWWNANFLYSSLLRSIFFIMETMAWPISSQLQTGNNIILYTLLIRLTLPRQSRGQYYCWRSIKPILSNIRGQYLLYYMWNVYASSPFVYGYIYCQFVFNTPYKILEMHSTCSNCYPFLLSTAPGIYPQLQCHPTHSSNLNGIA